MQRVGGIRSSKVMSGSSKVLSGSTNVLSGSSKVLPGHEGRWRVAVRSLGHSDP